MVRLVRAMGELGLLDSPSTALAETAARLAKVDLTTLMVGEFPELQGVMGGIYLEAEDAPPEVASAVRWHHHPVALEKDAVPAAAFLGRDAESRVFAAVALADKLDTLAGYFGLGETPTGSRDPYGSVVPRTAPSVSCWTSGGLDRKSHGRTSRSVRSRGEGLR